jgi:hypothetical protein
MAMEYLIVFFAVLAWILAIYFVVKFLQFAYRLVSGKFEVRKRWSNFCVAFREDMAKQQIIIEQKRAEKPKKIKRNRNYLWYLWGGLAFFGDSPSCLPGTGSCN